MSRSDRVLRASNFPMRKQWEETVINIAQTSSCGVKLPLEQSRVRGKKEFNKAAPLTWRTNRIALQRSSKSDVEKKKKKIHIRQEAKKLRRIKMP